MLLLDSRLLVSGVSKQATNRREVSSLETLWKLLESGSLGIIYTVVCSLCFTDNTFMLTFIVSAQVGHFVAICQK